MKKRRIIPLLLSYGLSGMRLVSSKETKKKENSIEKQVIDHVQTKATAWGREKGQELYKTHENTIKKTTVNFISKAKETLSKTTNYFSSVAKSFKEGYKTVAKKIKRFFQG
jgi:hypothetical protein